MNKILFIYPAFLPPQGANSNRVRWEGRGH